VRRRSALATSPSSYVVTGAVDDSQRAAARVVGITYLLTNATAMFAAFYAGAESADGCKFENAS